MPDMNAEIKRQPKGAPTGGEFAKHDRPEADTLLNADSVPVDDPFYGPEWPTAHAAVFEDAKTFADIDLALAAHQKAHPDEDDISVQWAAENRCRQLRAAGVPLVQSKLPSRNAFRSAQNNAELKAIWGQATEEPPGDGEASAAWLRQWTRDLGLERNARQIELVHAGVIPIYGGAPRASGA